MTVEMSAEDILSEIPNEELHNVGVVKGLLIMPPGFVQKYILPAIKVRKALKQSNEGNLPGGIETAIMFAFFDDSVLDHNNTIGDNLTDNAMIRAMVNHAKDHTLDHTTFMNEGSMGLITQGHHCCIEAARKCLKIAKARRAVGHERPRDRISK